MAGIPEPSPLRVDSGGGGPFTHMQAVILIGAEEASEFDIIITRQAHEPALEVTPQHGEAAEQHRVNRKSIDHHC